MSLIRCCLLALQAHELVLFSCNWSDTLHPASQQGKTEEGEGTAHTWKRKKGKGHLLPSFLFPLLPRSVRKISSSFPFSGLDSTTAGLSILLDIRKTTYQELLKWQNAPFFAVRAKKYLVNFVPLFQESVASSLNCRYPCLRALGQVGRGGGGTLVWSDWLTTAGDRLGKKLI